jgi:hypothetical protein
MPMRPVGNTYKCPGCGKTNRTGNLCNRCMDGPWRKIDPTYGRWAFISMKRDQKWIADLIETRLWPHDEEDEEPQRVTDEELAYWISRIPTNIEEVTWRKASGTRNAMEWRSKSKRRELRDRNNDRESTTIGRHGIQIRKCSMCKEKKILNFANFYWKTMGGQPQMNKSYRESRMMDEREYKFIFGRICRECYTPTLKARAWLHKHLHGVHKWERMAAIPMARKAVQIERILKEEKR